MESSVAIAGGRPGLRTVQLGVGTSLVGGMVALLGACGLLGAMTTHSWVGRNTDAHAVMLALPVVGAFCGAVALLIGCWRMQRQFVRRPLDPIRQQRWTRIRRAGIVLWLIVFGAAVVSFALSTEPRWELLGAMAPVLIGLRADWSKTDTHIAGVATEAPEGRERLRVGAQLVLGGAIANALSTAMAGAIIWWGYRSMWHDRPGGYGPEFSPLTWFVVAAIPLIAVPASAVVLSRMPRQAPEPPSLPAA